MSDAPEAVGRTIQRFLVDGTPDGIIIASIHGWTGSVMVAAQTTFGQLLARPRWIAREPPTRRTHSGCAPISPRQTATVRRLIKSLSIKAS
jgi:hypothetical protein